MTTQEIQSKLQILRERWLKEPDNRKTIELQAKCLKLALRKTDKFEKEVLETLV